MNRDLKYMQKMRKHIHPQRSCNQFLQWIMAFLLSLHKVKN